MNPEIRYWQAIVNDAEAELDAATTHADLKLAARGLMHARRRLLTLLAQETEANNPRPSRRRRRPPSPDSTPHSRNPQKT